MTHTVEVEGAVLTKRYTSWSRDEPGREWTALTMLARATADLVPTPLTRSDRELTMTVVPGEPLGGSLTAPQLEALGDALDTLTLVGPGGPSAHRNPPGTAEAQAERVLRLTAGTL